MTPLRLVRAFSPPNTRPLHNLQRPPSATMHPVTPARRIPPPSRDAESRAQGWARFSTRGMFLESLVCVVAHDRSLRMPRER